MTSKFIAKFVAIFAATTIFGGVAFASPPSGDFPTISGPTGYPLLVHKDRVSASEFFSDVESAHKEQQFVLALKKRTDSDMTYSQIKRAWISNSGGNITVRKCSALMQGIRFHTQVYNKDGTAQDVWSRDCYPGERFLLEDGIPLISLYCGNVIYTDAFGRLPSHPQPVTRQRGSQYSDHSQRHCQAVSAAAGAGGGYSGGYFGYGGFGFGIGGGSSAVAITSEACVSN
jgi:hypothetical protein